MRPVHSAARRSDDRSSSYGCVACGGRIEDRFMKWGYPIAFCEGCGTGTTRLEGRFSASRLYDCGYFEGERRDGYSGYGATEAVLRKGFRRTVRELLKLLPAGGRLLEIGCAYGFFLLEASSRFDVLGLEISDGAVREANDRGLLVLPEDDEATTLRRIAKEAVNRFDAVVMLDVIEHLSRPRETLRLVAEVLRPGGVLLLTTGDAGSFLARAFGRHWRLMTPPQHLYFFTGRGLNRLLSEEGFAVLSTRRPWKTVPAGLAVFQILRSITRRPWAPKWLSRVGVPVNLWDTVEVVAIRGGISEPGVD